MSTFKYDPNKTVSIKEDFLYKYPKLWNLSNSDNEDVSSLILAIMKENVGEGGSGILITDMKYQKQFVGLRRSLKILLERKRSIKKSFADQVSPISKC